MTFEEFYNGDISNWKSEMKEKKEVFEIQDLLNSSSMTDDDKQKFWTLFKSWTKKAFDAGKRG